MTAASHHAPPTTPSASLANLRDGAPVANTNRLRHGLYATVTDHLEPRALELAELIAAEPHISESDHLAVVAVARLAARVEAMADDLTERGMTTKGGKSRAMLDLYVRAERRLMEGLEQLGLTPRSRAAFAKDLVKATSLADDIRRRREAARRA